MTIYPVTAPEFAPYGRVVTGYEEACAALTAALAAHTPLPEGTDYAQAARGAYIVAGSDEDPDVTLVASGSEVSTLVAGAALLRRDGVKVRIVSAPSEGLFRNQSREYQESIIPPMGKVFGLTAGLSFAMQSLVGLNGKVWGIDYFGYSAPYKVLDEKFGFTAQNVYDQVKQML